MEQVFDQLIVNGKAHFGNRDSFSEFESDGTLRFGGDATVYDDLVVPLFSAKVGGANVPTWAALRGNINAYTFAVGDYLTASAEMLHGYKEGTDIEAHIHWATNGLEAVDKYVKWEIEYTIGNMSDVMSSSAVETVEAVIPANTPDRNHMYSSIAVIPGSALKIGNYIVFRIRRIASSGTAPTANPFALGVGIHYQADTVGSRYRAQK